MALAIVVAALLASLAPPEALAAAGTQVQEALPGDEFQECEHCPRMLVVPPGEFVMGTEGGEVGRPDGPPHLVRIARPFAIGKFEVTNREFAAFVADSGYETTPPCAVRDGDGWLLHSEAHWTDLRTGQAYQPEHPVACVNWLDARAYVAWLAEKTGQPYRLPSEAEWEYAARGDASGRFAWGDDPLAACAYANVYDISAQAAHGYSWQAADCDDGFAKLAPVGRLQANGFGLHDVAGNLWEWVEDCYEAPYPAHIPADGSAYSPLPGQCENRSVRGGSWTSRISRQSLYFRGRDPEDRRYSIFGFRVARSLEEPHDSEQ
ncbi:formylglycine-generating enzyme family protein [Candidatus Foliamicus sp.]